MHRSRLILFLLLVLSMMAARCSAPQIVIVAPGDEVTTFDFVVQVQLPPGATLSAATLNGSPLPLAPSGSGVYEAALQAGPPLLDNNVLVVDALDAEGGAISRGHDFLYAPGKAQLFRITDDDDLIRGPLAHSRLGDFMLANGTARFVVQDVAQRDLYSVGQFGGNLIDAELVSRPGRDQFLEVQPMLNVETVINAQTAEIVNDGQDGTAAILRTCGPDDLLDFVNPSSAIADAGITPPAFFDDLDLPIEACTDYILEPGTAYVRMDTTVFNNDTQALSLAVGDWLNGGGQLEQWSSPLLMGEALIGNTDLVSFIGYAQGEGVDYGLQIIPDPLGAPPNIFTTSGVSVLLYNANALLTLLGTPPPFTVAAGGQRTYTRYFSVGDGSGANSVDVAALTTQTATSPLSGCVTVAGTPLAGSRVSVVTFNGAGQPAFMRSQFVTEPGPCPNYSGTLPSGQYQVAAARDGSAFIGGNTTPAYVPVSIAAPGPGAVVDFDLPAPARLEVTVTNSEGDPEPARVTVVGFDPSPAQTFPGPSFPGFGGSTLAVFRDPKDRSPFGIAAFEYADAAGLAGLDVEPGNYEVVVSRGTEYSIDRFTVQLGGGTVTALQAQIDRVIDTPGFISSDFHVHGIHSADSRVSHERRVLQFAGEGVENLIMTDHHVHTDLRPTIAALGMVEALTSTVGEEITTFDYGHFNGYPFTVDPNVPSGGSTDWGRAAPPGEDFPSFGNYNATPPEIFSLAVNGAQATPDTTVQINHIGSFFNPLRVDTSVAGPITDGLDDALRAERRLPPVSQAPNLFFPYPALELWNGSSRGAQSEFRNERIGVWMNLLNKGLPTTMISDTDTHDYRTLRSAGARTWTAASTDRARFISSDEVARSVDAGKAVGGQGIYVQTRLLARDGSEGIADLSLGGVTQVSSADGSIDLEIHIQAPAWAAFDTIEVYSNAPTTPVNPAAPYAFVATPDQVLVEGDCSLATGGDGDFDIVSVPIAGTNASRQEAHVVVPYRGLTADAWFVVVVRGEDGACAPMFPVYASSLRQDTNLSLADLLDGNVGEDGVMALGVTNALYADVDGTPGIQPSNP